MKRYIIALHEFEGLKIHRYDGWFRAPFTTTELYTEDDGGWVQTTKTSTHLKLLLHKMEKMGKATKFTGNDRFERIWIIDVPNGTAMGQYYPYRDHGMTDMMVPPLESVKFMLNDCEDLYDLDDTTPDQDWSLDDARYELFGTPEFDEQN